jgi:hypothetical protein
MFTVFTVEDILKNSFLGGTASRISQNPAVGAKLRLLLAAQFLPKQSFGLHPGLRRRRLSRPHPAFARLQQSVPATRRIRKHDVPAGRYIQRLCGVFSRKNMSDK